MSLGVLNNIAAIYAQNSINTTQASLQTTLQQLSSGSKINSGADDAAGLSIVNGLGANAAGLTQSSTNAAEGVGLLQVADGALSQVTSLLTRAVTLATESSNGTLTSTQLTSANQEYQSILAEINNIGTTTTFNGSTVFGNGAVSIYNGDSTSLGASTDTLNIAQLNSTSVGDAGGTISATGSGENYYKSAAQDPTGTYSGSLIFKEGTTGLATTVTIASTNIQGLAADINSANISGVSASVVANGSTGTYYLDVAEQAQNLQNFTGAGATDVTSASALTLGTGTDLTFAAVTGASGGISYTSSGTGSTNLSSTTLTTTPATTLTAINTAIIDVAGQRGYIGSQINTLNAESNVDSTEDTNIVGAQDSISATNYGTASSNLSKYEILSQTGISALAQANSAQQEVLKLLQ